MPGFRFIIAAGLLIVRRADPTLASAQVTPATEFECQTAGSGAAATARVADHGGSYQGGKTSSGRGSDDNTGGDASEAAETSGQTTGADQDTGDGRAPDDQAATLAAGVAQPACDSTALTVGRTLTRATIRFTRGGVAVFKQIKLAV